MKALALALALLPWPALATAFVRPCPDDGRLKGVKIGSPLFERTVRALPEHQCLIRGPNGTFLVTPDAVHRVKP